MVQAQPTAVDERLCLALYRASHAMTTRYRPLLAPLGLTYTQYTVMSILWEDGTSSVRSLGQRLGLESSTLSPLLKRLESQQLVGRERDPADERALLVSLTAKGRRLKSRAVGVDASICHASGLSNQEMAELVGRLCDIIADLEK